MESSRSKSFEYVVRSSKQEHHKFQSKKITNGSKKIRTFKSSLDKICHLKQSTEKPLRREDIEVEMIPNINFVPSEKLTPIPRHLRYIVDKQQDNSKSKESYYHSLLDSSYHSSHTFCVLDFQNFDKTVLERYKNKNQVNIYYPVIDEYYPNNKVEPTVLTSVSNSSPITTSFSKSHLDVVNIKPVKRTSRKKSFFKCSLFRKRSTSRSKSIEKTIEHKMNKLKFRDQSRSLNRSNSIPLSTLSDRSLTLPNLRSTEVEVNHNTQLVSMDLIKDYLNRSNEVPKSYIKNTSIDNRTLYPIRHMSSSFERSLHSFSDSTVLHNMPTSQSLQSPTIDPSDIHHTLSQEPPLSFTSVKSAFDNNYYKFSNDVPEFTENKNLPYERKLSTPRHYEPVYVSSHYCSPPPISSAFEFWTRPYQEKMKASRRRLLDDRVGLKEAHRRRLSPYNVQTNEETLTFDSPRNVSIITENGTNDNNSKHNNYDLTPQNQIYNSNSFCNTSQYRFGECENIILEHLDSVPINSISNDCPLELPKAISHCSDQICGGNNLIYSTAFESERTQSTLIVNEKKSEVIHSTPEMKLLLSKSRFHGSLLESKDNKSTHSSSELILTRTPTPPHSFAESPVSSICPAPNEFISDIKKTESTYRLFRTNEDDNICILKIDPLPPVPPPRTDSIIRSLNTKSKSGIIKAESEYFISEDYPQVFNGANIDRCDDEQYHQFVERLPYKLTDFANKIQCRKSLDVANTIPENNICLSKEVDLSVFNRLKLPRKSINSWNTSDNHSMEDDVSSDSLLTSNSNFYLMKKSFSYDQILNNSDRKGLPNTRISRAEVSSSQIDLQILTSDRTMLKQYSHLYSLRLSPSHATMLPELSSSAFQMNKSKSTDLRNIVLKVSKVSTSERYMEKRKSVPNEKSGI